MTLMMAIIFFRCWPWHFIGYWPWHIFTIWRFCNINWGKLTYGHILFLWSIQCLWFMNNQKVWFY